MKRLESESGEEKNPNLWTTISEAILLEILARLPLRSIARFRSVCKIWKSITESSYFRRRFASVHESSSSSWSLMFAIRYPRPNAEALSFHGCERWGLSKSLASYIFLPIQPYQNRTISRYSFVASSNGLMLIDAFTSSTLNLNCHCCSFVGNPVLQQWVEIPPPPEPSTPAGLVTRMGDDGVVSSFKVVMTCQSRERNAWRVSVYSSVTGLWTCEQIVTNHPVSYYVSFYPSMDINGMLYLYSSIHEVLTAHDFYADGQSQPQVIPLPPVPVQNKKKARRCVTTSGGDVFLVEVTDVTLTVWRLSNNNAEAEVWQLLLKETNMATVNCFPMAMNPLDSDIIYLWSYSLSCLVSSNLRTQEFIVHQEFENVSRREGRCLANTNSCKEYMESRRNIIYDIMLSQFVLPQWMDPVPRPPS